MKFYSQKDPKWINQRLGTCNGETLGKSGCKVACYAMLDGRTPAEVDDLLTEKGGYSKGCLTVDSSASKILGLEFNGSTTKKPNHICIAETNHYAKNGVPQHFFIIDPNTNRRVDPLDADPKWEDNDYKIVSYRLFKDKNIVPNDTDDTQKIADIMSNGFMKDYGNRFDVKDAENAVEKYEFERDRAEELEKENTELKNHVCPVCQVVPDCPPCPPCPPTPVCPPTEIEMYTAGELIKKGIQMWLSK